MKFGLKTENKIASVDLSIIMAYMDMVWLSGEDAGLHREMSWV